MKVEVGQRVPMDVKYGMYESFRRDGNDGEEILVASRFLLEIILQKVILFSGIYTNMFGQNNYRRQN